MLKMYFQMKTHNQELTAEKDVCVYESQAGQEIELTPEMVNQFCKQLLLSCDE